MTTLPAEALIGKGQYPFESLAAGVGLDFYEAGCISEGQLGYRTGAERVLNNISGPKPRILDLEPRTGISTLAICKQYPNSNVKAITRGSKEIAQYKFGQLSDDDFSDILGHTLAELTSAKKIAVKKQVQSSLLQKYWETSMSEILSRELKASFSSLEETRSKIKPGSIDLAVGHQFVHWYSDKEITNFFNGFLYQALAEGGEAIFSTASQAWFDPSKHPEQNGFRYHRIIPAIIEALRKSGIKIAEDYEKTISPGRGTIADLMALIPQDKFKVEHKETWAYEVKPKIFFENQLPAIIAKIIDPQLTEKEKRRAYETAMYHVLSNNIELKDDEKHNKELVPIFITRKI